MNESNLENLAVPEKNEKLIAHLDSLLEMADKVPEAITAREARNRDEQLEYDRIDSWRNCTGPLVMSLGLANMLYSREIGEKAGILNSMTDQFAQKLRDAKSENFVESEFEADLSSIRGLVAEISKEYSS